MISIIIKKVSLFSSTLLIFLQIKNKMINTRILRIILTVLLLLLGVVSLFMSLSVSFDWFGIREMEGDYVPFVLYANMGCAVIYLITAWALWNNIRLGVYGLLTATVILAITFIAFIIYIKSGGIHEDKTIKAMTMRTVLTATMYIVSAYILKMEGIVGKNNK